MVNNAPVVKNSKNATVGYKGVFEGMDFPAYEYKHFPLMMRKESGETLIVEDEEAQAAAEAEGYESPNVGPPVHVTQVQYDDLQAELAALKAENAALKAAPEPAPAKPVAKPAAPVANALASSPK